MSVTVVVFRHPRKLLAFLKKQYTVTNIQPGIYTVEGDTSPTQIIVSDELSKEDNLWLTSLRNDLTAEQIERVLVATKNRASTDAYVYTVIEANPQAVKELYMKRKDVFLTETLDAIFRERNSATLIAEGVAKGRAEGKAEGKAEEKTETGRNMVLVALRKKFKKVPKHIERAVLAMSDPIALESLLERVFDSDTLDEFAEVLR